MDCVLDVFLYIYGLCFRCVFIGGNNIKALNFSKNVRLCPKFIFVFVKALIFFGNVHGNPFLTIKTLNFTLSWGLLWYKKGNHEHFQKIQGL